MPIIHIEIARGHPPEKLQDLLANVSRAAADSLSIPEAGIRVLLNEVDPEWWFSGGRSLADKQRSAR